MPILHHSFGNCANHFCHSSMQGHTGALQRCWFQDLPLTGYDKGLFSMLAMLRSCLPFAASCLFHCNPLICRTARNTIHHRLTATVGLLSITVGGEFLMWHKSVAGIDWAMSRSANLSGPRWPCSWLIGLCPVPHGWPLRGLHAGGVITPRQVAV